MSNNSPALLAVLNQHRYRVRMKKRPNMMADRTFERGRGCWNCTSWNNGDLAKSHWQACKQRDFAAYAAAGKVPLDRIGDQENNIFSGTMYDTVERSIQAGELGMCLAGKANGDFVHAHFLCANGWNGRQGSSIATGGIAGKVDKDIGELIEIADSRAKTPKT